MQNKDLKVVLGINMATHTDVYELTYGENIYIKPDDEGGDGWDVYYDNGCMECKDSYDEAYAYATEIDENLIVDGYGRWSGRKYWQLPDDIKNQIIKMAFGKEAISSI